MFLEYIQMIVILKLLNIHFLPESRIYYDYMQFSLVLFDFFVAYNDSLKDTCYGGDLLKNFEHFDIQ